MNSTTPPYAGAGQPMVLSAAVTTGAPDLVQIHGFGQNPWLQLFEFSAFGEMTKI
jgi:hypothetical protein